MFLKIITFKKILILNIYIEFAIGKVATIVIGYAANTEVRTTICVQNNAMPNIIMTHENPKRINVFKLHCICVYFYSDWILFYFIF